MLTNNTKSVCSHLYGCGKADSEPLASGNLYHLMCITALILVWIVGYMDPHITDWLDH